MFVVCICCFAMNMTCLLLSELIFVTVHHVHNRHERDCCSKANKQDEMGQNRTRNEISRMRSFLKISLKHFFMNSKQELVISFLMAMSDIS